jgi:excisionase family DNA binding protein
MGDRDVVAADLVNLAAKLTAPGSASRDQLAAELVAAAGKLVSLCASADLSTALPQPALHVSSMEPENLSKLLYSVAEAASRLGVSRSKAYVLVRDGHLRSVDVGSRTMIPAAALTQYVDGLLGKTA